MDYQNLTERFATNRRVIKAFIEIINAEDEQLEAIDKVDLDHYLELVAEHLEDFKAAQETFEKENDNSHLGVCRAVINELKNLQSQLERIDQKNEERKRNA
ncbi:hypothetical protein GGS26DRAFT_585759 [Hypomontagnella submonticulosa]|nr:hypothetical protein GGS26DRAFT_585759 [Hypomontagnella submonticulosa]